MSATCKNPGRHLSLTLLAALAEADPGRARVLNRLATTAKPEVLEACEVVTTQVLQLFQAVARAGECAEQGDVEGCADALRGAAAVGAATERMMDAVMDRNGATLGEVLAWLAHVKETMIAYVASGGGAPQAQA